MTAASLYLDLLKKSLLNLIYGADGEPGFTLERRLKGQDWPQQAKTMIGIKALDHIQMCVETVLKEGIPGDLVEAGVWRGGACILMRGILKAYEITDRKVWVADSFQGLPPPNPEKYPADAGDKHHTQKALAISLKEVKRNFEMYGLKDSQVEFLPGFFRDTLPSAPIGRLAVLRMDGDMYEATIQTLENLYPKLSPGGFAIADDYGLRGCRRAIEDYRKAAAIEEPIEAVNPAEPGTRMYWRKR